jgi:hypothetical protein
MESANIASIDHQTKLEKLMLKTPLFLNVAVASITPPHGDKKPRLFFVKLGGYVMKNETTEVFDSTDLRTIDRLINYFEKRHVDAFPQGFPIPDSNYTTDLENRRYHARLRGTTECLKELRESIFSLEMRE